MDKLSNELINRFLNTEKSVAIKFLLSLLEHYVQNRISGFFAPNVNKLFQLQIAKKVGLCIPDSYILSENHLEYGNFITKSLDNVFDFVKDKYSIINYTNKINDSDLEKIKTQSFVQKCIDKKFEVRVFYLHGITYSMGIFSQRNEKTEIDFRHYDEDFPNRNPPIKLPKKLDKKIKNFMTTLNLECGSLDFIYNVAGEFVFLEVNPIGQFGMTSSPCNYYLERIIAKHLLGEKSI
jgi:ATP-GRASP peptide maturase of grasp-with-spasm system